MSHLLRTALKASLRLGNHIARRDQPALKDERSRQVVHLAGPISHDSRVAPESRPQKPRCAMEPKMLSTSSKKMTLPERLK